MAREHAQVNVSIWQDEDFLALPPAAQHLYMVLWTHPGLSYCGVVDWRPGRIAKRARGWIAADVQQAADCLSAHYFLVIDEDTEECLIRSWVRWDGLMKQPRIAVSYANAYATVASPTLRRVVVHELLKMRDRQPELAGLTRPQVVEMLVLPSVSAKDLPTPKDPFGDGFAHGFGHSVAHKFGDRLGQDLGEPLPNVSGSVSVPPTPAPAPAPYSSSITNASRSAAEPRTDPAPETAQALVAEWVDNCRARPPGNVVGQVAKQLKALLDEGIPADQVRTGLIAWHRKNLHPSTLPSVLHEVREARPAGGRSRRQDETDQLFDAAMERAQAREQEAIA